MSSEWKCNADCRADPVNLLEEEKRTCFELDYTNKWVSYIYLT